MDDLLIRNINRKRTTINRYVVDSNSYWREELHPRVENLQNIPVYVSINIENKLNNNIWDFPVDEQTKSNSKLLLNYLINDYFLFVYGRRLWVYTETCGYWTEDKITETFAHALIIVLWDIINQIIISNYPLISDDLRLRNSKTYSNDERKTKHDNLNIIGNDSEQYTKQNNTRNKIFEGRDSIGSDTFDGRTTTNTTNIQDMFASPQDQGIKPSKQSDKIMNRLEKFQTPNNMGVEELKTNGDPKFTTTTVNNFEGDTSTAKEGRTTTTKDINSRVDENDFIEGNDKYKSNIESQNNLEAVAKNDTGLQREESLDMSNTLQNFYNIHKDRLILEIDNRMLPYFLNMKIARFTDHRICRENYV